MRQMFNLGLICSLEVFYVTVIIYNNNNSLSLFVWWTPIGGLGSQLQCLLKQLIRVLLPTPPVVGGGGGGGEGKSCGAGASLHGSGTPEAP